MLHPGTEALFLLPLARGPAQALWPHLTGEGLRNTAGHSEQSCLIVPTLPVLCCSKSGHAQGHQHAFFK